MWTHCDYRSRRPAARRTAAALLIAAAALSACATGSPYPPDLTSRPIAAGGQRPGDWWTRINNPPLDALVQAGFDNSPTLGAVTATLRRNRDALHAGDGLFVAPGVDMPVIAAAGTPVVLFTIGGPVAPPRAMDRADAARQVLAADIVNTVIARAAYHADVEALAELIAIERQQLAEDPNSDGLSARISANRATLVWLLVRYDQTEHLLARLTGMPFDQWGAPQFGLGEIQPPEPGGDREGLGDLVKIQAAATNGRNLASVNYLAHHAPYGDVLAAQARLIEARMAVIAATARLSQANVARLVASGGDMPDQ